MRWLRLLRQRFAFELVRLWPVAVKYWRPLLRILVLLFLFSGAAKRPVGEFLWLLGIVWLFRELVFWGLNRIEAVNDLLKHVVKKYPNWDE